MKHTRKLLLYFSVFLFAVSTQSCKDDGDGGTTGPSQNIIEHLTADGGYSVMLGALDQFGWTSKLNSSGNFTLLALSDNQLIADGIDLSSGADAELILNYHIISNTYQPADFPNGQYLTTEAEGGPDGEKLALYIEVVGDAVRFNGNNYIKKIEATNGVIYVMEKTCEPLTLLEALSVNPNITNYRTAVNLETATKTELGMGKNTVFATSNTKFIEYLNANNTTITSLAPTLRRVILHNSIILGSNKQSGQLSATETTKGEDMTITSAGGVVTLNGKAQVEAANGQCTDGVIHVISDLLN